MSNVTPRLPTEKEKQELAKHVLYATVDMPTSEEADQARGFVDNACIAVFDDYMSDGPGYVGKVLVVVWGGGPSLYECFTWQQGKIEKEECEF